MVERLRCPACRVPLPWWRLGRRCTCVRCGARLTTNAASASVLAWFLSIALGPLVWMPLSAIFQAVEGRTVTVDDWLWLVTLPTLVLTVVIYGLLLRVDDGR